jgi:PAS domain S-box-containing protein
MKTSSWNAFERLSVSIFARLDDIDNKKGILQLSVLSKYRMEFVHKDSQFLLQRGRGADGTGSVLLRSLIGDNTSDNVKWLRHELSLRAQLDASWAVRPSHLEYHDERDILIMEDPGGRPLDSFLHGPMGTQEFLTIAIATTEALGGMHRNGLIHKDIKPSNIFVVATHTIRLTGFWLVSTLPRERQAPVPMEVIAGTFAYMAPEQTGRMNRSIDTRSDLYSLGVIFYEMATGHLPFLAKDPLEWVHCHTALKPVPPATCANVPPILSSIIMKLLSKTADDRYQTAEGLAEDLRRCEDQFNRHGYVDDFPLGANDASDRLVISERLYGRDVEVSLLLDAFDRVVASGTPELVLVSGYSGVGKSSVVNELHKVLVPPRGLFASGKFDQYKRDIPYATIAQAFQSLVLQILGKPPAEQARWRLQLTEALGVNGQLIVDLIPEIGQLIGPQPALAELSAQDTVNRFKTVFRRFLGVFAKREHPLALFLDDLQWLDTATLQLLQHLISEPDVKHVLLVGAYRDNEVDDAHPLIRTIEDIRHSGNSVQNIVLSPLSCRNVACLMEDALHCKAGEADALTLLIYEKTGGNPFFVIQFVTELAAKALIRFNVASGRWQWDVQRISAMGFTDNVVDLMAMKISRLPEETKSALQRMACLGNFAELETLVLVEERPEDAINASLWPAVHAGLILRHSRGYSFLHDRVQEAAYSQIPDSERCAAHLRIGRLLAASTNPEQIRDSIFEIVNQFARGVALIDNQVEKDRVAALFHRAAQQARASTAYASALNYLAAGQDLLGADSWERQYDLAFALALDTAECEFLVGDLAAADANLSDLLEKGRTKVDLAAAYRLRITMHVVMSENREAVATALECLQLFDVVMTAHPTLEQVGKAFAEVQVQMNGRPIESLVDLPLADNPEVEAAMSVLSVLWAPAIFTDEPLVGMHVCHMVRLTLEHGVTAASPQGLGWFGIMYGHLSFGSYEDGYKFACLARDIVDRHQFKAYEAKALYSLHMIGLWTNPISVVFETIQAVLLACVKTGDVTIACYACNHMVTDRLARGDHLDEVLRESERSIAYVDKVGYVIARNFILTQQRWVLQMQGLTSSFATLDGEDFSEAAFEGALDSESMSTVVFWYWILKGQCRYMAGQFEEAEIALENARAFDWGSPGHIQVSDSQFYAALTYAALDNGDLEDPRTLNRRAKIRAAEQRMARWASASPTTFAARHVLITAEIARIEGRHYDAMTLYEGAIALARTNGLVQYEALAHELAARFHLGRGFRTSGEANLNRSRECYQTWGAYGKVRDLEKAYPILLHTQSLFSPVTTTDDPISSLDILAVVKASQAISRQIVLDDLVKTLLAIALEVAGAERGLLLLKKNDHFYISAAAATARGQLELTLRSSNALSTELPESGLKYVIHAKKSLIIDDARTDGAFGTDDYIERNRCKSLLFVPILRQGKMGGVLYLENNLTSHCFTLKQVKLLELLASQAAISLENARLYTDLRRSEAFLAEGQRHSASATWSWNVQTGEIQWSSEHFYLFGYKNNEIKPDFSVFLATVHVDDRSYVKQVLQSAVAEGKSFSMEFRAHLRTGEIKHFLTVGRELSRQSGLLHEYMGTLIDITQRKNDAKVLMNAREELRRAGQMMVMGELAASIAHEVNQPLAAMVNNASACLRWLSDEQRDIAGATKAARRVITEGHRAGAIIKGVYRLATKQLPEVEMFDVNATIHDVLSVMRSELELQEISLRTCLCGNSTKSFGDRVQIRQVILNLVRNGIEAMSTVNDWPRILWVESLFTDNGKLEVVISDSGEGLDPEIADRMFEAFITTKADGMGMGLSICRTIVEAHGGTLWWSAREPKGASFHFTLPVSQPEFDHDSEV